MQPREFKYGEPIIRPAQPRFTKEYVEVVPGNGSHTCIVEWNEHGKGTVRFIWWNGPHGSLDNLLAALNNGDIKL